MSQFPIESSPTQLIAQQVAPRVAQQPGLVPGRIVLTLLVVHDNAVFTIYADRENEDIDNFWLPGTIITTTEQLERSLLQHATALAKLWTGLLDQDFAVDHVPVIVHDLPYHLMPPTSETWDGLLYWTVCMKVDLRDRIDRLMEMEPHEELCKVNIEDTGMKWRVFWLSKVQASLWSDLSTGSMIPVRAMFGLKA